MSPSASNSPTLTGQDGPSLEITFDNLDNSSYYRSPAIAIMKSLTKAQSMLEMSEIDQIKIIHQSMGEASPSSSKSTDTEPSPAQNDDDEFFFYDEDSDASPIPTDDSGTINIKNAGGSSWSCEKLKITVPAISEEKEEDHCCKAQPSTASSFPIHRNTNSLMRKCMSQSTLTMGFSSIPEDRTHHHEEEEEKECKVTNSIDEGRSKGTMEPRTAVNTMRRCLSQSILKTTSSFADMDSSNHSGCSSTSSSSKIKRTTSFSKIEIREYNITLGDNPGGAKGPPVSLDWKYNKSNSISLDLEDYEEKRPPRRTKTELYMQESIRKWRLMKEKGYSLKEMEKAAKTAEGIRKSRRKSLQQKSFKKTLGRLIKVGSGSS